MGTLGSPISRRCLSYEQGREGMNRKHHHPPNDCNAIHSAVLQDIEAGKSMQNNSSEKASFCEGCSEDIAK